MSGNLQGVTGEKPAVTLDTSPSLPYGLLGGGGRRVDLVESQGIQEVGTFEVFVKASPTRLTGARLDAAAEGWPCGQ